MEDKIYCHSNHLEQHDQPVRLVDKARPAEAAFIRLKTSSVSSLWPLDWTCKIELVSTSLDGVSCLADLVVRRWSLGEGEVRGAVAAEHPPASVSAGFGLAPACRRGRLCCNSFDSPILSRNYLEKGSKLGLAMRMRNMRMMRIMRICGICGCVCGLKISSTLYTYEYLPKMATFWARNGSAWLCFQFWVPKISLSYNFIQLTEFNQLDHKKRFKFVFKGLLTVITVYMASLFVLLNVLELGSLLKQLVSKRGPW